ncbi:carboxylating nicotinate-nucleotide diphosphorylase [Spongisporangium articulatum]|uniref:nicotinate-nucleotide diphosphorylase (carboxylating) n=1 Tax=Spongisporangium articulatum TaxID=3362603 RepID=A0ABW8ANH4_9ACTN
MTRWPDEERAAWQSGAREALVEAGLDAAWVRNLVLRALDEDLGGRPDGRGTGPSRGAGHDVTTEATVAADAEGEAHLVARADGVLGGLPLLPVVLAEVAAWLGLPVPYADVLRRDGDSVVRGDVIAVLRGRTRVLLVAERTALNLISRCCGIATHTRAWARELEGTGARVLDTRKTTPGLRMLEKYAVRCGGGTNKRMGLYDVAMVKDNHKIAAGSIKEAYRLVTERFPDVDVQVEVTTPDEAVEAVTAGAAFLLCDNMSVEVLAETVRRARAAAPVGVVVELEATGGLTLPVANAYARTGVDYLSVGALTHSSPILDVALDLV